MSHPMVRCRWLLLPHIVGHDRTDATELAATVMSTNQGSSMLVGRVYFTRAPTVRMELPRVATTLATSMVALDLLPSKRPLFVSVTCHDVVMETDVSGATSIVPEGGYVRVKLS
jgi:hypothetical protein